MQGFRLGVVRQGTPETRRCKGFRGVLESFFLLASGFMLIRLRFAALNRERIYERCSSVTLWEKTPRLQAKSSDKLYE